MAQEIERKYLVNTSDYKKEAYKHTRIVQGYLSTDPQRTVRIRIRGEKGYITIKGIATQNGLTRYEWEKEIPLSEAEELLLLCKTGVIDKIRYEVKAADFTIEIDEFRGENEGLVIAEVELGNLNDHFEKPTWLGAEVTGISKYYNSMLTQKPFTQW